MRYEAVLFDMDGVLIDTHEAVTQFWLALGQRHQVMLTQADFERHIYGCPALETLDLLFPGLDADAQRAVIEEMTTYEIEMEYQPVPGVLALVEGISANQIPIALVTSGESWKVGAVLSQLGLAGRFKAEITASDVVSGKPDPAPYLAAATRLGISASKCIVFEDSLSGMQAARTAGALGIGVGRGEGAARLRDAGAIDVIPDFRSVSLITDGHVVEIGLNGRRFELTSRAGRDSVR